MNPRQFDRILRQVLFLPVVVLLLAAVAVYWGIQQTNQTVRRSQAVGECIRQIRAIQRLIVDEETGLRGYQVTGAGAFMEPFDKAQPELDESFARLRTLLQSYPEDLAHLDRLKASHDMWLVTFARPVISILQGGGTASDIPLNLIGKSKMDVLREDVQVLLHDSEVRRAAAISQWQHQIGSALVLLLSLAAGAGLLIGLFTRSRMQAVSAEYGNSQRILERRAGELYASEENLRTTLASICDGVITSGVDGRVLLMNDNAQELTGWTQAEALDRPIVEVLRLLDEGSREPVESPAARVNRLNDAVGHTGHTVLIRRDGSEILIDDSGAPMRDKTGRMNGVVTVFRDVTLERKTQAALLANEKLAVAGRLAATIAHEIHNPLDSVANLLYLAQSGSSAEEARQFLVMAEAELNRVTQISRAMLGLYRESKAPVAVDLREMLCALLMLLERRFQGLGVALVEELPPGLQIEGFPAELRQVFTNLITNAAEAAASGGPVPSVRVSACSRGIPAEVNGIRVDPGAVVHIEDNGPGMDPGVLAQIFRPFFTTKGEQGTGLGLWVSQGIIRKHGGQIEVESSTDPQDHGTRMSVFLGARPVMQPGIG